MINDHVHTTNSNVSQFLKTRIFLTELIYLFLDSIILHIGPNKSCSLFEIVENWSAGNGESTVGLPVEIRSVLGNFLGEVAHVSLEHPPIGGQVAASQH